jgi:hypothetical protein
MASFTINKDQIIRLKVFNDYCKKMESISPIEEDQAFLIKGNKLHVYGKGSQAAQIDAIFDIGDSKIEVKNDSNSFGLSVSNFVNFLEKTQDDEINVSVKDQLITIKGKNTKQVFKQTLIFNKNQKELTELENFISETLKIDEFKKPIKINIADYKDIIMDLTTMSKFLDINQSIELNKENIRAADNLNVLKLNVAKDSITSVDNIILQRDITLLFKNVDNFIISDDKKWFYFDITEYGIKILFIPKSLQWQYPADDDIKDIIPIKPLINVRVGTEDFYRALDHFENIFDADSWKYKQIKFKTPLGFTNDKQLIFHYDNMKYEVTTELNVDLIEKSDKTENFEFIIPTLHFKFLKNILEHEDYFDIIYSSKDISEPNGAGIIIKNKDVNIILAKMMN